MITFIGGIWTEIESLKIRGIFTVEALAQLDENKAQQLEISQEQQLAQKFIAQARDNKQLLNWQKKEEKMSFCVKTVIRN